MSASASKLQLVIFLVAIGELVGLLAFLLSGADLDGYFFREYAGAVVVFCAAQVFLLILGARVPLLSLPVIFIAITFLFANSGYFLFASYGNSGLAYLRVVNLDFLGKTMPLVCIAFVSYLIGALMSRDGPARRGLMLHLVPGRATYDLHAGVLSAVCVCLIAFSFLVITVETLRGNALALAVNEGYRGFSDARKAGATSVWVTASFDWFLPWATVILIGLESRTLRKLRQVGVLVVAVIAITVLSGDRTAPMSILLCYTVAYSLANPEFRLYKFVTLGIVVLLAVPLLQVVRMVPIGDWNWKEMLDIAGDLASQSSKWNNNIVQALAGPYSPAIMSFMATLMQVNHLGDFHLGMDYMRSLAVAIPFGAKFAPNNSQWVKDFLVPNDVAGPGFMAMAEAYLNFGIGGIVVLYWCLGRYFTELWRAMWCGAVGRIELAFQLIVFYASIVWVRNEFSFVARTVFWAAILIFVVPRVASMLLPTKRGVGAVERRA